MDKKQNADTAEVELLQTCGIFFAYIVTFKVKSCCCVFENDYRIKK